MSEVDELLKTVGVCWADDVEYVDDIRRQMVKFAVIQLSDAHLAEDAVQEALAGALKNAKSFEGRAAFKTWVFAILKNKIIDIIRQRKRLVSVEDIEVADEESGEEFFGRAGIWLSQKKPSTWDVPDQALESEHFWRVFDACVERMPARYAKVFMMREMIELSAQEICEAEGITTTNLHVLLHRARLRLRECLEANWFEKEGVPC